MAASKSVCVLLPNGRRQNVKVTLDSTVLQVLEDACQKHGYNPEDYDLKHYNKILDVSLIFRFSGLPNNAQLEMQPCTKARKTSNITIGIQLENGDRKMGDFPSSVSLKDVLVKLCPDENAETVVLIYMHRKVHGDELQKTTLRSLGLNSGKAMLRLLNRDPEEMKHQAHVYAPPVPKISNEDAVDDNDEPPRKVVSSRWNKSNDTFDPVRLLRQEKPQNENSRSEELPIIKVEPMEVEKTNEVDKENEPRVENAVPEKNTGTASIAKQEKIEIEYLGERNALVFSKAEVKAKVKTEPSDAFFEVTVNDAHMILRDIIKKREEMEESPLLTSSQRQLEIDKRVLDRLNKYTQAVIRVQFPDQLVLQGLFHPLEFVQTVKNFVKEYLVSSDCDFSLYQTPPRRELDPEKRLVDEDLVPSAILHFSGSSELREEIKSKLIDPETADEEAIEYMTVRNRGALESTSLDIAEANKATPNTRIQHESGAGPSGVSRTNKNEQAPKWFKNLLQSDKNQMKK